MPNLLGFSLCVCVTFGKTVSCGEIDRLLTAVELNVAS